LRAAIDTGYLNAGSAQKLSGRLTWATQWLFHKVGRAMIKPIYAQQSSGTGTISAGLRRALGWWLEVLEAGVTEMRSWTLPKDNICRLYVDAASTPACCAAVLFIDGQRLYTSWEPSVELMKQFKERRDKQIMTLVHAVVFRLLVKLCALCMFRKFWQSLVPWSRSRTF
jgi:hypothetical protein